VAISSNVALAVAVRDITIMAGIVDSAAHARRPSTSASGLSADSLRFDASYPRDVRSMRLGQVPYEQAYALQKQTHGQRVADEVQDTVLLLQHPPVYTAGRLTQDWERPVDGTPVIDIDRGGRITWHGPGQIVGYPILKLTTPLDVVAYVRRIEDLLILACADLGLATVRVEGRSGVWVPADERGPDRKVAAIGVRVAKKVSLHGFALNCDPDLSWFERIVPCGLPDAQATSLTRELGRTVTVAQALPVIEAHLEVLAEPVRADRTDRTDLDRTDLDRTDLARTA
jgi:lipoyl(octanoyl) transferase